MSWLDFFAGAATADMLARDPRQRHSLADDNEPQVEVSLRGCVLAAAIAFFGPFIAVVLWGVIYLVYRVVTLQF